MHGETGQVRPGFPAIIRTIHVGGISKPELISELRRHSVAMNELGERLLASDRFTLSETRYSLVTAELSVGSLGFPQGATFDEIMARAGECGLSLCPLELGPHLRLQYLDQPEGFVGKPVRQHQAPFGSLTIAAPGVSEDIDFPKGFYLRRIQGVLWLRGYTSGPEHVWDADDQLVFVKEWIS